MIDIVRFAKAYSATGKILRGAPRLYIGFCDVKYNPVRIRISKN